MKKPIINRTKLPEVMEIIEEANSLMTEKDCESDEAAKRNWKRCRTGFGRLLEIIK